MESDTQCPLCREVETPRVRRILRDVRIAVFGYSPREKYEIYGRAVQGSIRALAGHKAKGWYERHREAFEESGDEKEMERMLRHVKESE